MDNMKEANTSQNITGDDFLLSELFRDIRESMIAIIINDLIEEDSKENPDTNVIAQLEKEKQRIRDEAKSVYGNKESMRRFIDNYAPIIRARYAKDC